MRISAIVPPSSDCGPASRPEAPEIRACTFADCRAIALEASLPSEPSGPGGRPAARAAAARAAVHRAVQTSVISRAISWRTTGSPALPAALARSMTSSGRPARCGYHLCGSAATAFSAGASSQAHARPSRPGPGCGH